MRTIKWFPWCLLLAWVWPLQPQQTTVKDRVVASDEGAGQKETVAKDSSNASLEAQSNLTIVHLDSGTQLTPFVTTPELQVAKNEGGKKDAEKELIQLEKQWAEAGVEGDVEFFERTATDDYMIVDCHGDVRNKAQEIANFRHEIQTTSTVSDMKVRVYGGSAVVVGAFTIAGTYAGQPMNLSGNFTDLWIRPDRTWQLVSTQNTCKPMEVAQPGPPDSFFIAKEKEDWEALKHQDKAAAMRLLADDFIGMYDFGFFTKSEWVKQIDEQYTVDDYTIENAKLLRPSANTALLLYTSTCKGTSTWAEYCSHASRISDLFVERNGQWLALFSQDTQATSSEPAGVSADEKAWPHGFHGDAYPPGTVFSHPATTFLTITLHWPTYRY
jgi:ketosteroid isomerase-like protein